MIGKPSSIDSIPAYPVVNNTLRPGRVSCASGESRPRDSSCHDQISEHQIDPVRLLQKTHRTRAIVRHQNAIPQSLEHGDRHLPNLLVILNDEDRASAAGVLIGGSESHRTRLQVTRRAAGKL